MNVEIAFYVLYAGVLFFVFEYFKLTRLGIRSEKWVETEGEIIDNNEEELKYEGMPKWIIKYHYNINGEKYISTNIVFKPLVFDCDKYITKYPIGTKVNVYYNPNKYKSSVLEKGYHPLTNIFLICIILSLTIITIIKNTI